MVHFFSLRFALLAFFVFSTIASAQDAGSLLRKIDEGFVQLFEQVAPLVVVIEAAHRGEAEEVNLRAGAERLLEEEEDPHEGLGEIPRSRLRSDRTVVSEGSGFFIREDGHILTNSHVVEGARRIEVRLKDGRRFSAKLVGSDDRTDIAVLKIEATALPIATLGDSDALRVGQLICAIGAPFHQDYSFTCGWVSGKGRTNLLGRTSPKQLYEDYIQTDAFINPGNSGGPLFDVEGRVVGMNTLINGIGRGLAFAIPSNMLRDISEQLISHGKVQRPWLGIRMIALPESGSLRERFDGLAKGIVVSTIEANSPAYESDLRPIDVITAIDGKELADPRELQREILRRKVGALVQLTIWRAGRTLQVPVTTAELPESFSNATKFPLRPEAKREVLGLVLLDTETGGPRIVEIAPDSPAARVELAPGDTIIAVDGEPQNSAEAAADALESAAARNARKGVLITFERGGKKSWVVIERASR